MKIPSEQQKTVFNPDKPAKNTDTTVRSSANLAKPAAAPNSTPAKPAALPVKAAANQADLISLFKLPRDNLSRSTIAFARFFSLPLESKFLNSLRKEALSLPGKGMAFREAVLLGSAAAADKGLKLDKKALGEYAAAIEGIIKNLSGKSPEEPPGVSARTESRRIKDREGGEQGQEHEADDGSRQENDSQSGMAGDGFRDNNPGNRQDRHTLYQQDKDLKNHISGGILEDHITDILGNRPMLDLINRIPGKNGRWVVIPFSFEQKGFEFSVSLRILLLDNNVPSAESAVRLTADIFVKKGGEDTASSAEGGKQKYWFISLENPKSALAAHSGAADEAFLSGCRVKVYSETAVRSPSEGKRQKRELAKALNIPFDSVEIIEKPLLFADSRDDHLPTVDEEV